MEEIWKIVDECPNYSVSNLGRVKNNKTNKLMKPNYGKDKYHRVELSGKKFLVHRLVAKAFIPNPDNLPAINHKDSVRNNNVVENLEWCTIEYNTRYSLPRHTEVTGKKILQIDSNGNVVKEWESISEAARQLNIPRYVIHGCCNNNSGFDFKYK